VYCFDLLVLLVVEFVFYTAFKKVINIILFGVYWECFNGGLFIEMKLQKNGMLILIMLKSLPETVFKLIIRIIPLSDQVLTFLFFVNA